MKVRIDPSDVARYVAEALSKGSVPAELVRIERGEGGVYAIFKVDLCRMNPMFVCEGGDIYLVVNV